MVRACMYLEGLDRGGIETLCVNLIEPMRACGCELSFLVLKERGYAYTDTVRAHGCTVDYLVSADRLADSSALDYCKLMYRWARKNAGKIDVLHMHISQLGNSLPLMLAAKMGGVRNVVLHSHNSKPTTRKIGTAHRVCLPLLSVVRPSALLACSDVAGEWMFGSRAYVKIANGIDLVRFRFDASARKRLRSELDLGDRVVLCSVGRFAKVKNHTFLLDVFKAFRDLRLDSCLLLVGSGELEGELRAKSRRLGLEEDVVFAGLRDDVPNILSASDCLVFPSIFEGLSIACVEAQANGIPAVLSDGVSPETVMSNKTAIVPLSSPPKEWAKVILGQAARRFEPPRYTETFDAYDIRLTAASIVDVYRSILSAR